MENQQNGDGDFQVDNDPDDFPSSSQSSGDVRRRDQEPEILKKNPPPVRPRPASTYGRRRTPHSNFNESNATSSNNSLMQQPTPIHDYEASPLSNTSNSFQELSEEPQSSSASAQNPSDIPSTSNGTSCATAVDGVKTRTFAQQVSREEMQIGEQARLLLNLFIQERAGVENAQVTPIIRDLCPADKSSMATAGFSDESLSDIALTLRRIGDDISRNAELNNFIEQVPVHSTRNVFMKVCLQIFQDGNLNWGRVVALFYFAYRLIIRTLTKGLDSVPWARELLSWAVEFIVRHVARWIISRGGWRMIKEWFGVPNQVWVGLCAAGLAMTLWALFKKD